ncbi:MAG: LLM class flavin-dependent oxidoreductase [Chloroflexi bacterium]|nr:LLM class flavin-dependent oxidoreductase [Chloroflexota bacterium]
MAKVLFSVGGSSGLEWNDFLEICQTCDELGFHGFYPSDHLMQINPGRGPTPARLEGLTVMAAMAGHTKNLRLGMLVVNNNFRHPVITAKMVNTIDHASGGRAELGMGSGNVKHEFDVHGMPFPPFKERADRLDEALSVIRAIWTEEPASFQGTYYSLNEAPQMPKPVQQPHPPIIVGGRGNRTMQIAAKHATDYNQIAPLEEVKVNLGRMQATCDEAGRDFSSMRHSVQIQIKLSDDASEVEATVARGATLATQETSYYATPEEQVRDSMLLGSPSAIVDQLGRWVDAGIDHFILMTPRPFDRRVMERFAQEVAPQFA